MPDNTPSWEEAVETIQNKLLNDALDYIGRMQEAGSPVLFLGDYKQASISALNSAVKELVLASRPKVPTSTALAVTKGWIDDEPVAIAEYLDTYQANIIKAIEGKS